MFVRCSACGLSRGPPRAAELFIPGIRIRRQPIRQTFGRISVQREYFQISILFVWKNRLSRGTSSKSQSPLFGSIGHSEAPLPNLNPLCLEVLVTQRHFFQISSLFVWKYWSLRGTSSKYQASLFGSTGHSEVLLPNLKPLCLEVLVTQRRFFQISRLGSWKNRLSRGASSKYHASAVERTCHMKPSLSTGRGTARMMSLYSAPTEFVAGSCRQGCHGAPFRVLFLWWIIAAS